MADRRSVDVVSDWLTVLGYHGMIGALELEELYATDEFPAARI